MRAYFIISILGLSFLASCGKKESIDNISSPKIIAGDLYARGASLAASAVEARITFRYKIWTKGDQFSAANNRAEIKAILLKKINKQIDHLFGSMSNVTQNKAVPKLGPSQVITIDDASIFLDEERNQITAEYTYEGTILIDNAGLGRTMKYAMPRNPDLIYAQTKRDYRINPCTDSHYNSQGDFWYFWNASSCSTITEGREFDYVSMNVTQLPNTTLTYPEYNRLVRKDELGKKRIKIYQFNGYVHEMRNVPDDLEGVEQVKSLFDKSRENSRTKAFIQKDFKRLSRVAVKYTFEKYIPESDVTVELINFYGNTGSREQDNNVFYAVLKEALEEGSIIFYNGHSGLGGNLDVQRIESVVGKIKFDINNYQILFFDSCSSFPYYTQMYFKQKGANGSKNFDIVTNGLSAYFHRSSVTSLEFLNNLIAPFEGKEVLSWQKLIDTIHLGQNTVDSKTYFPLLSVSGDEDNPKMAPVISLNKNKTLLTTAVNISALQTNNELLNISASTDKLSDKKHLIDTLAQADATIYLLSDKGSVYVIDPRNATRDWASSAVNSIFVPFKYMTYIRLASNMKPTLYLMGSDNVLYCKDLDVPIKKSARQHPLGLSWVKLELNEVNNFIGTDETGVKYQWIAESGRERWTRI